MTYDYLEDAKVDDIFYRADLEEEINDINRTLVDATEFMDECTQEEYAQAMKEMEEYYNTRDLAYDRIQEALAFLEDMTDPISDTIKAILKGEPHD